MLLIIYYCHCCFRFLILICDTEIVTSQKFFEKLFLFFGGAQGGWFFWSARFPCNKDLNLRKKCLFKYASKTFHIFSLPQTFFHRKANFVLNFAMRHTYIKGSLLLAFGLGLRWTRKVAESQNKDIYFILSQFWMSVDSQKWASDHVPDYSLRKRYRNF